MVFNMIPSIVQEVVDCLCDTCVDRTQDIANLCSTCSQFRDSLKHNNTKWRKLFYKKWPRLVRICEEKRNKREISFRELIIERMQCTKQLHQFLAKMSERYHCKFDSFNKYCDENETSCDTCSKYDICSDEEDFDLLCPTESTHSLKYYFFIDELKSILQRRKKHDLTSIYYGKKFLPYMKYYHLISIWQEFVYRSIGQQLLEEVVTFAAQWYQPEKEISFLDIEMKLFNIIEKVFIVLEDRQPNHPIFSVSSEQLSFWRYNNIIESHYNRTNGKQILNILCEVLFDDGFNGIADSENRNISLKNVLINCVIENKTGSSLLLAVIFHSIARRLGIRCDIISLPDNKEYKLIWKTKDEEDPDEITYYEIDIMNGGSFLNMEHGFWRINKIEHPFTNKIYDICDRLNSEKLIQKLTTYILERIKFYTNSETDHQDILTRCLELLHLIMPDNITIIKQLGLRYMKRRSVSILITALCKIDSSLEYQEKRTKDLIRFLLERLVREEIEVLECFDESTPKTRKQGMKFVVGMIVTFNDQEDTHDGVIIGWFSLNIPCLQFPQSVYYRVLCEEDKTYCVHEDDLKMMRKPRIIKSNQIGKYFRQFKNTYYLPNTVLEKEYPDDILHLF